MTGFPLFSFCAVYRYWSACDGIQWNKTKSKRGFHSILCLKQRMHTGALVLVGLVKLWIIILTAAAWIDFFCSFCAECKYFFDFEIKININWCARHTRTQYSVQHAHSSHTLLTQIHLLSIHSQIPVYFFLLLFFFVIPFASPLHVYSMRILHFCCSILFHAVSYARDARHGHYRRVQTSLKRHRCEATMYHILLVHCEYENRFKIYFDLKFSDKHEPGNVQCALCILYCA